MILRPSAYAWSRFTVTFLARIVIVTHTDLDGVASAAIYARLAGAEPDKEATIIMSEPYKLHRSLADIARNLRDVNRVAIMDLGPNADTFDSIIEATRKLVSLGVKVEWYDHHRWSNDWVKTLEELSVHVYIDTSTCAAGVVAKYAPQELEAESDEFIEALVSATCAADLWKWDNPLAPRLYRVVDRYKGARGDKWRRLMLKGFYKGALWWPELDDALAEYLRREFKGFASALKSVVVKEFNCCKVVFVLKKPGPPNASILGNALLRRFNADIAVIVRVRGKGVSFRSQSCNVRDLAYVLGGGGHPRAAGAPLKLPLLYKILSLVYPKLKLYQAIKLVTKGFESVKPCHIE